ncbi:hypothetical protein H6A68_05980 [Bifidobacterium pullorum subsp. saeculare]|uniref:hypothetical protein n=1 Tax=Bifidobacterium pullorum TaxID=78448 RepID=UPI00195AACA2|nr:hypothetical protein [Bifidobacterium pullorum]MBM6706599.1 hypothetical protein [Bifidobacterium pullorum subsp. saeculare]
MDYQDINAATITRWIEDGWEWGKPIDHNTYAKALAGEWDILLTPTRPVPHSWFPEDLRGLRVLGLASGGGQQMPILTARGARCTVLDYTPAQLDADRTVACTSSASPASGPRSRRSRRTDGRLMPSPWGRAATEPRRRTFPYRIMPLGAA